MLIFYNTYFLIVILIVTAIGVIASSLVWFLAKEDKEIAKTFTLLSSKGMYVEALKKEFPIESFENGFKNSKPYVDTSFSSVSMENNVTVLKGTAKTEDGCSSLLDFKILDGKIISFNISPLCLN